ASDDRFAANQLAGADVRFLAVVGLRLHVLFFARELLLLIGKGRLRMGFLRVLFGDLGLGHGFSPARGGDELASAFWVRRSSLQSMFQARPHAAPIAKTAGNLCISASCLASYNLCLSSLCSRGRTGFDRIREAQVACRG